MTNENFKEMAISLVCALDEEYIIQILWGEQWTSEEIQEFINKANNE